MLESDGLLGLSPQVRTRGASGEELHLLVNELEKDGVIDKAVFAVYLADTAHQSKITFGGYDTELASDGISWMKINS